MEFNNFLDDVGHSRDFCFFSAEVTRPIRSKYGVENTTIVLTTYKNKQKGETLMAEAKGYGNWIKWE